MLISANEHQHSPKFSHQLLKTIFLILCVSAITYVITIKYFPINPLKKLDVWQLKHGNDVYGHSGRLSSVLVIKNALHQKELPRLVLDIGFKQMQLLYQKRDEALKKGILIKEDDSLVPAKIRYLDKTVDVKLRLKGDWTDHLTGDKWSYRVQLKGKDELLGLRRFSIQHPKVRGYQGELLFFETLKHVGILAPRLFFVDVVINGNDIGIMALEEHFSKELLEANERREGVIVRFDESLLWEARASKGEGYNDNVFHNYQSATIDAFGSSRITKSKKLSSDYATAVGLLRGFVDGVMAASDVFDADLLGKYLAVVEIWGARHSLFWHNQRFYLNPVTMKLEPVGFDANVQQRNQVNSLAGQTEPFVVALLQDPKVFSAYDAALKNLANEILHGQLISQLAKIEAGALEDLHQEYYFLDAFPMEYLQKRAEYLLSVPEKQRKNLIIDTNNYPEIVKGYIVNNQVGVSLELLNLIPHDVLVSNIACMSENSHSVAQFNAQVSQLSLPILLPPTPAQTLPKVKQFYFSANIFEQCKVEITASIEGQEKEYHARAVPYYPELRSHPLPSSDVSSQLAAHKFLSFDEKRHQFSVQPGKWKVEGSIIIPAGNNLIVQAGTKLQFTADQGIFCYGVMELKGSAQNPIFLEGLETNNIPGTWQGVVVMNAPQASTWQNVFVKNTTGIAQSVWQLTGGVTFYKSNITLKACNLLNNKGEDALNIIQSEFLLKDITISDTASDAFDSDFSKGVIDGGLFVSIGKAGGGDAVDISGSNVKVIGTKFKDINDKALSVGERSVMDASNVEVVSTGAGAASKDGSFLTLKDSSIKSAKIAGLMAYAKKPEFGPGRIEAKNIVFSSDVVDARAELGSSIIIDGVEAKRENVNVKELYMTVMKPGLRQ